MSDIKLKPCPFCGGTDFLVETYPLGEKYRTGIVCRTCLGGMDTMKSYPTSDEARSKAEEAWNRRAEPMQTRKFDELISYFNRNVSNMDIDQKYKIELLGMITAIGFAHEKELHDPTIESERKTGRWRHYEGCLTCSECGIEYYDDIMEYCGDDVPRFCPNCGADMREPEDIPMEYFESGGR